MIAVITPVIANLCFIFWLAALLFLWRITGKNPKARKRGFIFLLAIWFLGTRPVAEMFLMPLENNYRPPKLERLKEMGAKQIVVLTGGGFPVQGEVLTPALPPASLSRFMSGMELCRRLGPDCTMIFSGTAGRQNPEIKTSEAMKLLSLLLVPSLRVISETRSTNTAEHPPALKPLLRPGPFVLVTSAFHMPRSIKIFRKAGLDPIPYPIDFLARGNYRWSDWLPSFESLWKLNVAFREYLASAFLWFKG